MMAPVAPRMQAAPQYVPPLLPTNPPRRAAVAVPRNPVVNAPRPTSIRAQSDDDALELPPPEAFGIRPMPVVNTTATAGEDWAVLLRQLEAYGVEQFQFDAVGSKVRLRCNLPQGGQSIGMGSTKAEAIRQVIQQLASGQ